MITMGHPTSAPKVGDAIDTLEWRPSTIQLFRFSAVTWNPHRIHYDQAYARAEGYPDTLVQSHLHGCFLAHTLLQWAGPGAELLRFGWKNRHFAVPGDVLTVSGSIVQANGDVISCELEEVNQTGQLCAPGWGTVRLSNAWQEGPA